MLKTATCYQYNTASVTTGSALLADANPKRVGLTIWNNSANSIYVNFDAPANSSTALCKLIPTFASWELWGPVIWTGKIYGIRNAGNGACVITEFML